MQLKLKKPSDYGFNFKEYRKQQVKAINAIMDAIDKGKRYIISELPTGTGKSLIAMTLHKLISEINGGNNTKTYIVVSTKTLQNQYMREFNIPTVKGRNNFHCLIKPKLTVDKAMCNIRKCSRMSVCPYYVQRDRAIKSDVSIHNYAYYLASMNYTNMWKKADLVVFDEAHTMDGHLMSFVSLRIPKDILMLGTNVIDSLEDAYSDISFKVDDMRESLSDYNEESDVYKTYMDLLNSYIGYMRKIRIIIDNYDKANFIIEETAKSYVFRPVWTSSFSDLYFDHGDVFLMMSATIGSPSVFVKTLGIDSDNAIFIRGSAMFDVKNRPIKIVSGPSINYKNLNIVLPTIVDKVDTIINIESGDDYNNKGVIHVPSYNVANYIYHNSKHKSKMLIHDSVSRDNVIMKFINSEKGSILVSPSVHTGMDFKYDIARWQIIVKVPYADLTDKVVHRRFIENPKWYTQDAIIRVVQAYGRIVRSYDDWGTTYILDGNIYHLINKYSNMFPAWFLEAFKFCYYDDKNNNIICRGDN